MALLKERLKNGEQVPGTMVTTFASPPILRKYCRAVGLTSSSWTASTARSPRARRRTSCGGARHRYARVGAYPGDAPGARAQIMEMGASGLLRPIRKQPNRRVCWWTAPNTRPWDTGAFAFASAYGF